MARDKYLEKFIDSKFADLKEDLRRIDEKSDDRDLLVKKMDDENKKRLDALEKDVGFVKWLFQLAGAAIAAVGTLFGIWKGVH